MKRQQMDKNDEMRHSDMLLGVMTHTLNERLQGGWCPECLRRLATEINFYLAVEPQFPRNTAKEETK